MQHVEEMNIQNGNKTQSAEQENNRYGKIRLGTILTYDPLLLPPCKISCAFAVCSNWDQRSAAPEVLWLHPPHPAVLLGHCHFGI